MSLYLCVIDKDTDEEFDAVEVGPYSYFGAIRDVIRSALEPDNAGEYKLFLEHADSQGEWGVGEIKNLKSELAALRKELSQRKPKVVLETSWYLEYYKRARPSMLDQCFFDVDGVDLFSGILELCEVASERRLPISFQ